MSFLTEKVKSFFAPHKKANASSRVNPRNVLNNLSDDNGYLRLTDFFDYQEDNFFAPFGDMTQEEICLRQMEKIQTYRNVAMQPEVSNALDIITNEIIFSYDGFPLKLSVNIDNDKLQEALEEAFQKVIKIGNMDKNLFDIVKRSYIDGQLIVHCEYDPDNIKKGIQRLRIVDPCGLYFDFQEKVYKYTYNSFNGLYCNQMHEETYSPEEITRMDFGLYQEWLCLSYLEYAIKTANILKSLEDLLLPLRFSRSISRRVFNIDISDLPEKRGAEYIRQVQDKFKYRKFYNNETGEISNQQHITSMVEDYWFANRNGQKGTTVDTIDETGNLGEITDILYYNKKLYRALNIPTSKLDINPDADHMFNIETDEVTQEDLRFMTFVSRVRKVYAEFFKDLLKRQVVSTSIMTEKEWVEQQDAINIEFTNENLFIERMKVKLLQNKIDSWESIKTVGGTVFSFKELMSRVFGLTENEIDDQMKSIENEKRSHKFDIFYKLADLEIGSEYGMMGQVDAEGNPADASELSPGIFVDRDSGEPEEAGGVEPEEQGEPQEPEGTERLEGEPEEYNGLFKKYMDF
jgi:hypothetical protein